MKKLLCIVLSALFIFGMMPISVSAYGKASANTSVPESTTEYNSGYYTYTVSNGEATIIDCDESIAGDVAIPSKLGNYPVGAIGEMAFDSCFDITGITIPDGVKTIGYGAFMCCRELVSISIPASATEIEFDLLSWCSNLSDIKIDKKNKVYHSNGNCIIETSAKTLIAGCSSSVIPTDGSVTCIGFMAFHGVEALEDISIPGSIIAIEESAFEGCINLKSITVAKGNKVYYSKDNCVIETASKSLIVGCMTSIIPTDGSVTSIGAYAFGNCLGLTDFTIPEGIKTIGNHAFSWCTYLTGITIPKSVTNIGKSVFDGCDKLTIKCYSGSCAEQYAKDNGIPYEIIKEEAVVNPFRDIPVKSWYTEASLWCNSMGYITGTTSSTFNPNGNLTRAMFVQILAKIDGTDLSKVSYAGKFSDVIKGKWYANAVQWAVDSGVTSGISASTFGPDVTVSREQLATFFFAYAKYKNYDTSATVSLEKYKDAKNIAGWAKNAVSWAVAEGLISGTSSTTISPKTTATRAQAAVIFKSFVENYVAKQK